MLVGRSMLVRVGGFMRMGGFCRDFTQRKLGKRQKLQVFSRLRGMSAKRFFYPSIRGAAHIAKKIGSPNAKKICGRGLIAVKVRAVRHKERNLHRVGVSNHGANPIIDRKDGAKNLYFFVVVRRLTGRKDGK
jgi:hypothetical protein